MTITKTEEISNSADIIDSRDVIARIEALEEERSALDAHVEEAREERNEEAGRDEPDDTKLSDLSDLIGEREEALRDWDEGDEGAELKALKELAEEAEGYAADWRYGEALIRDSYFETYARDLAEDIGAIKSDAQWPNNCIDWKQAARELQMDYTSVDFDGVTYWVR
jgi:hypothetical protein